MLQLVCVCLLAGVSSADAQEPVADKARGERWAVILVGIPGDKEHETLFREIADAWQKWLVKTLNFPADHVLRLPSLPAEKDEAPARLTADAIRTTFAELQKTLRADDALWVFTLGHGNYDGKHAWFHVAGRDPSEEDFGRWLSEVHCREQVLWLTHANSGWLIKPLSKAGRIVIAATAADDESNETEFPQALATVAEQLPATIDADHDGHVSVAEFYLAVVAEVLSRFKSDNRLPTEHPQLDDNGDGRGTEDVAPKKDADGEKPPASDPSTSKAATAKADGELARKTFIPFRKSINPKVPGAIPE